MEVDVPGLSERRSGDAKIRLSTFAAHDTCCFTAIVVLGSDCTVCGSHDNAITTALMIERLGDLRDFFQTFRDILHRGSERRNGRNVWDVIWTGDPYAIPHERTRRATRRLKQFRDRGYTFSGVHSLLDLGCGSGQTLALLSADTSRHGLLAGIDISPIAINRTQQLLPAEVNLLVADVHQLPFADGTFDIVTAFGVLEHCPDLSQAIAEVVRVMRPSGRLYLTTSNFTSIENVLRHVKERTAGYRYGYQHNLSRRDLQKLLSPYLKTIDLWVVQGDWDRCIQTVVDRTLSIISPAAGRYLYAVAEKH